MIICLGTTPAIQRVMIFDAVKINGVNRTSEVIEAPAGKSVNVARVLCTLGEEVIATGFLGGDRGQLMRRYLDEAGIRHDFVSVQPRTRMCVTVIDRSAHAHTELVEESRAVEPQAWGALEERLKWLISGARMLILSGSLTPGAPADFYGECARLAAEAGVPAIVDAQGAPLMRSLSARPLLVKPNRSELGLTLGIAVDSDATVVAGMRRLMELGAGAVVVTLGPDGAMAAQGSKAWRIHVPVVTAVNTIGSGDAFTAGLAAALARGDGLGEACRLGAACGCSNALTLLAGQVHMEDVARLSAQVRVEEIRP